MKFAVALAIWIFLPTSFAAAASSGGGSNGNGPFWVQKQQAKEIHRWTLQEWLETKDKMKLMDFWLAIHSPAPYEFYLSGTFKTGTQGTGNYYGGWDGSFAAYATIFGLELIRQTSNASNRWLGLAKVRVLGYHDQATNLTFHGGVKEEMRSGVELWNPVAGVSVTMYFFKYFGIEALYRHTFSQPMNGLLTQADRLEAGALIDFSFLRVYLDYVSEVETDDPTQSFRGYQLGTRLYF